MGYRDDGRETFGGGGGGGGGAVDSVNGQTGTVVLTAASVGAQGALVPTAVKTADYNAAAQDFVPCDTTSNAITVTLPTTPADKTLVGVKIVIQPGTNGVTIACGGADVINKAGGATSASLVALAESYIFQYKSSTAIWYIIEHDAPRSAQYMNTMADLLAPLGSLTDVQGGVYVGKRALDKWRYTKQVYRTALVLTDSLGQGDVGGLDPWPERLHRDLGNWNGPRLTAGPGFYGMYRSGSLIFGSGNGDREWAPWGTWSTVAATINYDLAPYSSTIVCTNANATALRTVSDAATTLNSATITSATMAFVAGDVGALITGGNIPPNTYIRQVVSATNILATKVLTATGTNQVLSIHGAVLTWTRPIGSSNICRSLYDNTTASSTTITCPSANFHQLDVGKMVTGGQIPVNTIITAVTDYQTATISNAASGSGPAKELTVHDGRTVSDAATTNTSTTITSATAAFVSSDVGAKVVGTNIPAGTYIASVQSPTSATLSIAATGTGSAQFLFINTYQAARFVHDMASSAGSATVTSATAAFTQNDVGRQVQGNQIVNNTTIASVTNATTAVLSSTIAVAANFGDLFIGSANPVNIAAIELFWIDGITSNGATFGYSTNGGTSWTTIAQTTTGGPILNKTTITVANPTSLIIRANVGTSNTSAAKSQVIIAGIATYQTTPGTSGMNLYNVARDGFALGVSNGVVHGGIGDSMAFLDNGIGGTFPGFRPDLVIVLFSNDQILSTSTLWNGNLQRLLDRVQSYADVVLIGTYEMGDGRALATTQAFNAQMKALVNPASPMRWTCADGVTNGTTTITSATIGFMQSDVGRTITGTDIPGATTITAVASATSATISNAASGSGSARSWTITGKTVDTGNAHVDLYEAYAAEGVTGYTAAAADGLMYDTVHPSQIGHNEIGSRISRLVRVFS